MPDWSHIVLLLAAYLIGGLSPGYWLVKRASGIDLRATGSGATGATNAGRILGKRGFWAVMFFDILKGMLIVLLARHFPSDASLAWQFAASFAVVAGHIWPVWLGFRGGKGVATFYGAWCPLFDARGFIPALVCLALSLILKYVFRRSFKNSWLAVHALFPAGVWWLTRNHPDNVPVTLINAAMILAIWLAHRENIAAMFGKTEARGQKSEI